MIEKTKRKAAWLPMGEIDFIEATEWINGEGIDFVVNTFNNSKSISLTYEEIEAFKKLTNCLQNYETFTED